MIQSLYIDWIYVLVIRRLCVRDVRQKNMSDVRFELSEAVNIIKFVCSDSIAFADV